MLSRRSALVSFVLAAVAITPALTQDQSDIFKISLVKSAGPYEIKGESGVIGMVVSRAGDTVVFKPCTGDSFELDRRRLISTNNKCADSPSTDENPLVASCDKALNGWNVALYTQAIKNDGPIGTTFFQKPGEMVLGSVVLDAKKMAATIDSASQLKDCGPALGVVGFDKEGLAKVSLIPSLEAIQLDETK
ncbi:hypothetical protein [Mesorhizobium neociceri]|uniref:Uncharacterized protein n=1 Tax=Mesorhizobium neociceri TaxID=1307853 RepID=A0A838B2H4_9HYPH|nr:hypothetical protein [Mesorhizobium neociceri]MBA1140247.1 hypothetical protein [Mesorhizobium neociceri]